MTALWSGVELSAALSAAPSKPPSTTVSGVSIDSRTLASGRPLLRDQGRGA